MKNNVKHIVVISDHYPSEGRPVYIFVQQLVNQIVDMGYEVSVIAPQSLTNSLLRHTPVLKRKTQYKTDRGSSYLVYRPYYLSAGNASHWVRKLVAQWRKLAILSVLKRIKCDVVYGHFWGNIVPVSSYCKQHSLPLFVACGEGDNALENMVQDMSKEVIRQLTSMVTGMISVSSENKRKCIEYGLITQDRVIVLPNCVNTDLFKPQRNLELRHQLGIKDDDFVIAFVGGFIKRKGAQRVTDAIEKNHDKNIKSIFIGKPMGNDNVPPKGDSIVFMGAVEHDDIPMYLNASDLFVLPTLKEGCSNAIVEALVVGLPVVSSKGAFNDDILNEHNSIRVDPMNTDEIAEAICKMKSDKQFYDGCRKYLLDNRYKYSIMGRAKSIMEFIESKI